MRVKFRVFNFRRKDERRNYFDTEIFQIYGMNIINEHDDLRAAIVSRE